MEPKFNVGDLVQSTMISPPSQLFLIKNICSELTGNELTEQFYLLYNIETGYQIQYSCSLLEPVFVKVC